eukprot:11597684-Alexandrium_andersonii.AAC.1
MSASLVGSEMCIRDSPEGLQSGPSISQLSPSSRGAQEALPSSQRRFTTVSYTHLTLPTICSV